MDKSEISTCPGQDDKLTWPLGFFFFHFHSRLQQATVKGAGWMRLVQGMNLGASRVEILIKWRGKTTDDWLYDLYPTGLGNLSSVCGTRHENILLWGDPISVSGIECLSLSGPLQTTIHMSERRTDRVTVSSEGRKEGPEIYRCKKTFQKQTNTLWVRQHLFSLRDTSLRGLNTTLRSRRFTFGNMGSTEIYHS